jgi:hypothetical protein
MWQWLDTISCKNQAVEIRDETQYISSEKIDHEEAVACYPGGIYLDVSDIHRSISRQHGYCEAIIKVMVQLTDTGEFIAIRLIFA